MITSFHACDDRVVFEWVFAYKSTKMRECFEGITLAKIENNKIADLREYRSLAQTGENSVNMIYVFWTCRTKEEAGKIIHQLLDQRLIACASILPEIESIYRWEGKIEEGKEVKVILKTQAEHFNSICHAIQKQGSYEVPEISQIDVTKANPKYLSWVVQETST